MSKETNITFNHLQGLIRNVNKQCKENPEDEKLQERRRALLELRRNLNGDNGVSKDKIVAYTKILSDGKREIAKKLEELELDEYSLQNLQLADDLDVVVLEVQTVELEPVAEIAETPEIDGNK